MEKIALVTGSSRGIGRAVARELARQGWRVCVNYRVRQDCAESLAAELAAEGHAIMTYQADVSQRQQVQAMVRAIQEKWGPVSLLVNNAGVAGQALFQDVTDEMWHRYFSTNVDGAYHAIQAVLPAMLHAHEGCILNISSIWGQRGASCEVTYSCTKAALIGLTRSLAPSWYAGGYRPRGGVSGVGEGGLHHRSGADGGRRVYTVITGAKTCDYAAKRDETRGTHGCASLLCYIAA